MHLTKPLAPFRYGCSSGSLIMLARRLTCLSLFTEALCFNPYPLSPITRIWRRCPLDGRRARRLVFSVGCGSVIFGLFVASKDWGSAFPLVVDTEKAPHRSLLAKVSSALGQREMQIFRACNGHSGADGRLVAATRALRRRPRPTVALQEEADETSRRFHSPTMA